MRKYPLQRVKTFYYQSVTEQKDTFSHDRTTKYH